MKIEFHDVDHGGCVVVTTPSGKRIMLDCGVNHSRPWYPSVALGGSRIDLLFLMNLDEDHVEDLPYLWEKTTIGSLFSNPTVPAPTLRRIKTNGMKPGVRKACAVLDQFGPGMIGCPPEDLGGVALRWFWNRYGLPHTDTNNLSLAVFIEYRGCSVLFGGDLESAGWRSLQAVPGFNEQLRRVKVYVASHHGRENGQCEALFDHCRPEVILISDGPKQYVSQETNAWYSQRATGIPVVDEPAGLLGPRKRYVMTTRRDGTMTIDVGPDGRFLVRSESPIVNTPTGLGALGILSPTPALMPNALAGLGFGAAPGAFENQLVPWAPAALAPRGALDQALGGPPNALLAALLSSNGR